MLFSETLRAYISVYSGPLPPSGNEYIDQPLESQYFSRMKFDLQQVCTWYLAEKGIIVDEYVCSSRDIFQGRLDHFYRLLAHSSFGEDSGALLSAIAGEIGNNCFDHNLGQWHDVSGCWFQYNIEGNGAYVAIADRGRGILSSLRAVRPELENDQQALEVAFHKQISGRSPERRGNGLKFVRNVINGDKKRGLYFASGTGKIMFGGLGQVCEDSVRSFMGTLYGKGAFALIQWSC